MVNRKNGANLTKIVITYSIFIFAENKHDNLYNCYSKRQLLADHRNHILQLCIQPGNKMHHHWRKVLLFKHFSKNCDFKFLIHSYFISY